jgi:hypothetical protein
MTLLQDESEVPEKHRSEKQNLLKVYQKHYRYWRFQLKFVSLISLSFDLFHCVCLYSHCCFSFSSPIVSSEGFNLLFYGIGSKKSLLEDFAQQMFTDGPTIIVQGYFPNLNIQNVHIVFFSILKLYKEIE